MEKKDYLHLTSNYSYLADYEERHRKELIDFIHEAFEKHGNEFEYKCDTHDSWQAKNEDEEDEFEPMEDLPIYMMINVNDDDSHEVYPYRIYQEEYSSGYKEIYVDGWDYRHGEWVEDWTAGCDLGSLSDIAGFINAVLVQEQEEERLASMEERIDWEDLEEDVKVSIANECLWAKGAPTPEEESMHMNNMEELEHQLELVRQKDFRSLLEYWDEDYFKDFLKD